MDNLRIIIEILILVGGLFGAWVIVNKAITRLITQNESMEKQFTSLELHTEKEIKRLEDDYKERFDEMKKDQRENQEKVDKNFIILYSKIDLNTKDILDKLEKVKSQITKLEIKIGQS